MVRIYDREIVYVSGYVYCRPNSAGSYQIISMISTHRGGDHTSQEDISQIILVHNGMISCPTKFL